MRNPEERSPQEWAAFLRLQPFDTILHSNEADVIAARMDDLAEALRLLREAQFWNGTKAHHAACALLARYEEGQDDE